MYACDVYNLLILLPIEVLYCRAMLVWVKINFMFTHLTCWELHVHVHTSPAEWLTVVFYSSHGYEDVISKNIFFHFLFRRKIQIKTYNLTFSYYTT